MTRALFAALAVLILAAGPFRPAGAVLSIDIRQGVRDPLPVALVPFSWEGQGEPPGPVAEVVGADLRRSGLFRLVSEDAFLSRPHVPEDVRYKDWRLVNADALVIGRVRPADSAGQVKVRFRLYDVYSQEQIAGMRYTVGAGNLRSVAHRIANTIHEELVGWSGAFDTRLGYVVKAGERFALMVSDADGANPRQVLRSDQPILSPAWSPAGTELAYVSFEQGRSVVYRHDLATGRRSVVAAFEGINSAPDFAPDGERLALSLSRDGNPEIYVLELGSGDLRRITRSGAIDTEPTWGPEGRELIFTSDRGGSPQLYRVDAGGGAPRRLTFEGQYNASPSWSPKGEKVALITGDGSRFAIGVLDLESGEVRTVTEAGPNESPSFAPNGRMILYATQGAGGAGELAIVSVDGNVRTRLQRERDGDIREPAWSPE